MERQAIYVGSGEVTERYIGNRLVWKKVTLLLTLAPTNIAIYYDTYRPSITAYKTGTLDTSKVKYALLSGEKIEGFTVEISTSFIRLRFENLDSINKALEGLGWARSSGYYQNQILTFFGG